MAGKVVCPRFSAIGLQQLRIGGFTEHDIARAVVLDDMDRAFAECLVNGGDPTALDVLGWNAVHVCSRTDFGTQLSMG